MTDTPTCNVLYKLSTARNASSHLGLYAYSLLCHQITVRPLRMALQIVTEPEEVAEVEEVEEGANRGHILTYRKSL